MWELGSECGKKVSKVPYFALGDSLKWFDFKLDLKPSSLKPLQKFDQTRNQMVQFEPEYGHTKWFDLVWF